MTIVLATVIHILPVGSDSHWRLRQAGPRRRQPPANFNFRVKSQKLLLAVSGDCDSGGLSQRGPTITVTVAGQKNAFRSCDENSGFSRDLILMKVSELNGIFLLIFRSICRQF